MITSSKILIDHPAFKITLVNGAIINVHHKEGEMSLSDFYRVVNFAKDQQKKFGDLYVVNTQDLRFSFSNEAWRHIRSKDFKPDFILAQALVAKELHFRILAKFHARVTRNKTEYKVVGSMEEAVDWLQTLMNRD